MTETGYWNALRPLLKDRVYAWKINANFTAGVPDWWGSGAACDIWIENKRIKDDKEPPASISLADPKHYLTVNQQKWLISRHAEGRNVGVLLFSKVGHVYFPDLTWQEPIPGLEFRDRAVSKREMADHLADLLGEIRLDPGLFSGIIPS